MDYLEETQDLETDNWQVTVVVTFPKFTGNMEQASAFFERLRTYAILPCSAERSLILELLGNAYDWQATLCKTKGKLTDEALAKYRAEDNE